MGLVLPDSGTSWTAIDTSLYIEDMRMKGTTLKRQVEVDVPRIDLAMRDNSEHPFVRVFDGSIFYNIMHNMYSPDIAEQVLCFCTQTCLAQPYRALQVAASEKNYLISDGRQNLVVRMTFEGSRVSANVTKKLILRCGDSLRVLRDIHLIVEYDSQKNVVFVGIT